MDFIKKHFFLILYILICTTLLTNGIVRYQLRLNSDHEAVISEMKSLRNKIIDFENEITYTEWGKILKDQEQINHMVYVWEAAANIRDLLDRYDRNKEIREIQDYINNINRLMRDYIILNEDKHLSSSQYRKIKEIEKLFANSFSEKNDFGISRGLFTINFSKDSYNAFKRLEDICK